MAPRRWRSAMRRQLAMKPFRWRFRCMERWASAAKRSSKTLYRDVRILPIPDATNEILALIQGREITEFGRLSELIAMSAELSSAASRLCRVKVAMR